MSKDHITAVLGGGIAGLSAAVQLQKLVPTSTKIVLIEATKSLGGCVSSDRVDGFLMERGCRGIRPVGSGKDTLAFVESIGLAKQTILSSSVSNNRFVIRGGTPRKVPSSLLEFFKSPLMEGAFSWLLQDLSLKDPLPADMSVRQFFIRQFGVDVADGIIDAVMSGIYAGDISKLSAASTLSLVYDSMKDVSNHSSLIRKMVFDNKRTALLDGYSDFVNSCAKATSVSFVDGLSTLTVELERILTNSSNVEIIRNTSVTSVEPDLHGRTSISMARNDNSSPPIYADEYILPSTATVIDYQTSHNTFGQTSKLSCDAVICALPEPQLWKVVKSRKNLLSSVLPPTNNDFELPQESASVAVVSLAYKQSLLPKEMNGFGYLVPKRERGPQTSILSRGESINENNYHNILGVTFDSSAFPLQSEIFAQTCRNTIVEPGSIAKAASIETVPPFESPETRLTVMMGGATAPSVVDLSATERIEVALKAVHAHLGISVDPHVLQTHVAINAIPQYNVGHRMRVNRIFAGFEEEFGPLFKLIGNSWKGVGISDTVSNSLKAAKEVAEKLQ